MSQKDHNKDENAEMFTESESMQDEQTASTDNHVIILQKQIEKFQDQVARLQAELENSRRRMEQEVTKAHKFGVERLVSELIPVADSLTQGLQSVTANNASADSLRHGMELTLTLLHKILQKNGVVEIAPAVGDTFNPAEHEAMSMRNDPDAKPHTILQVLQKGYALHGRVLRAAMVIVAS